MFHGTQVDVYLQHSCVLEQFGANAVDLVCDSRSVLIGFSDGTFQLLSWQSQVRLCRTPSSCLSLLGNSPSYPSRSTDAGFTSGLCFMPSCQTQLHSCFLAKYPTPVPWHPQHASVALNSWGTAAETVLQALQ